MDTLTVQEPVFLIETEKIVPNPFQPRKVFNDEELKELANSIREFGILQPLVVTKLEEIKEDGTKVSYQLIAGERRFRAAKLAGLERVPAIIRNVGLDRERLELAIVENVQRANLNAIESARAYTKLQDLFGLTQREIAQRIGKSRESIANTMRLLQLPSPIQDAIGLGKLSESQARLLLSVDDLQQQQAFFDDIVKNNMTVRDLKGKIDYYKTAKARQATPLVDPETDLIKRELEESLGAPVKVEKNGATGKITIEFYSPEELASLLIRLKQQGNSAETPMPLAPSSELPPGFSV